MADDAQARGVGSLPIALLAATTAVVVALLVWQIIDPPSGPTVKQIAEAVSKRLEEDGYLNKKDFDSRMTRLEGAVSLLLTTENFERGLKELKDSLRACCATPPVAGRQPRIWVVFDNAKLEDDEEGNKSLLGRLTPSSPGIAISGPQRDRLDKLAAALRACAGGDHRVVLNIQGYSSTREFVDAQGRLLPNSEDLNVRAANLRAEAVIKHLKDQELPANNGIDVLHDPWEEYHDIRRPFLDSHEQILSTDQELLNRVVLVELVDAGRCAVEAAGRGNTK